MSKYRHKESGRIVTLLGTCQMKVPTTGSWIEATTYRTDDTKKVWVRSKISFDKAFVPVTGNGS